MEVLPCLRARNRGDDVMYSCPCCGLLFEEPDVIHRRENLDGENGWCDYYEARCPDCGEEEIEEYHEEDEDEL